MRLLITVIAFLFLTPSLYGQAPSMDTYLSESIQPILNSYNITSVPEGFNKCSYDAFLKHADKNDDGFSAGRETVMVCFPKYLNEITFSDSGREMKKIVLPYFEAICLDTNRQYESRIDVDGYCKCLTRLYTADSMPISKMINPNFVSTDEYQTMALMCMKLNPN